MNTGHMIKSFKDVNLDEMSYSLIDSIMLLVQEKKNSIVIII